MIQLFLFSQSFQHSFNMSSPTTLADNRDDDDESVDTTTFGPSFKMAPLVLDHSEYDEIFECYGPETGFKRFYKAYRQVQKHYKDYDAQNYLRTRITKSKGRHVLHTSAPNWFRFLAWLETVGNQYQAFVIGMQGTSWI